MYDHLEDIMYVGVPKVEILESLAYYKVPHYISVDAPNLIVAYSPFDNFIIKYLPSDMDMDIIGKVEITEPANHQWFNTMRGMVKQHPKKFIVAREW